MIRDHSDQFLSDLARAIDDGLRSASLEGAERAAGSMRPAPGAEGQLIATRGFSRPGNPPFVRTGRLRSSLGNARLRPQVWGFGTNVRYGRFLEKGTNNMAARPFLRPVMVRDRVRLENEFARTASRSLARGVTRGSA